MIYMSPVIVRGDTYWQVPMIGGPWDGDHLYWDAKEVAELPQYLAVGPTSGIMCRCKYDIAMIQRVQRCPRRPVYIFDGVLPFPQELYGWAHELAYADRPRLPDRDYWGKRVRDIWIRWAIRQPHCKASWTIPYDDLSEPDKEADRMIGEGIALDALAIERRNAMGLGPYIRED